MQAQETAKGIKDQVNHTSTWLLSITAIYLGGSFNNPNAKQQTNDFMEKQEE
jgi:hypothetical protein